MSEIAKPIPDTRVGPKRVAPVGGAIKRLIDIILAAAAIGLMLPLLVLCGVATFLASGRPIIARHRRIGFRGRAFERFSFEASHAHELTTPSRPGRRSDTSKWIASGLKLSFV